MDHSCNKFIIKEGKFIRDFEGMYQHLHDPWQQKETSGSDLMNNAAFYFLSELIKKEGIRLKDILDIGCALGYYAPRLLSLPDSKESFYVGTDVSSTVIAKADCSPSLKSRVRFVPDDIRVLNDAFRSKFDLIFSAKTLYYVAPEIDRVLENVESYLSSNGLFCLTYNQRGDSFSNQWLTYELLRKKLLDRRFIEKLFVEINRLSAETFMIGIYQKGD